MQVQTKAPLPMAKRNSARHWKIMKKKNKCPCLILSHQLLNPISGRRDVQHPPTENQLQNPQNCLQIPPNFVTFLFLLLHDLISKKNFLVFHNDFGCLEGGEVSPLNPTIWGGLLNKNRVFVTIL